MRRHDAIGGRRLAAPIYTDAHLDARIANVLEDNASATEVLDTLNGDVIALDFPWVFGRAITVTVPKKGTRRGFIHALIVCDLSKETVISVGYALSPAGAEASAHRAYSRRHRTPLMTRDGNLVPDACECGSSTRLETVGRMAGYWACMRCCRWQHGWRVKREATVLQQGWSNVDDVQYRAVDDKARIEITVTVDPGREFYGTGPTFADAEEAAFEVFLTEIGED